jgi:5-methylcytosine-specific restriction enzyme A
MRLLLLAAGRVSGATGDGGDGPFFGGSRAVELKELLMPMRPPRVGAAPARAPWANRTAAQRIRGRRLQTLRAQLFDASPLCVCCQQAGRVEVATVRDHIRPLSEGGTDDPANIQPLCAACHARKTDDEARRGAARVTGGV